MNRMTQGRRAATFAETIEGARGTIAWTTGLGGGMRVEILAVGDGWVEAQKLDGDDDGDDIYVIPVASILWFKWAGEED